MRRKKLVRGEGHWDKMATNQILIRDHNPYSAAFGRQGASSMKDLTGWRRRGGDSHGSEGDADTFHREDIPQSHQK
jgi:hypothetical protein